MIKMYFKTLWINNYSTLNTFLSVWWWFLNDWIIEQCVNNFSKTYIIKLDSLKTASDPLHTVCGVLLTSFLFSDLRTVVSYDVFICGCLNQTVRMFTLHSIQKCIKISMRNSRLYAIYKCNKYQGVKKTCWQIVAGSCKRYVCIETLSFFTYSFLNVTSVQSLIPNTTFSQWNLVMYLHVVITNRSVKTYCFLSYNSTLVLHSCNRSNCI